MSEETHHSSLITHHCLVLWATFISVFLILWAVLYAAMPAVRWAGRRLTQLTAQSERIEQFVAKHRERFASYLPVLVIIAAGALITAWAGDGFLDLAENVREKSPALQKIDVRIHDWTVSHRQATDTAFFGLMSTIGGPAGIAVVVGLVSIALAVLRRWRWVIYLLVTTGGGGLLNMELKRYFARARPAVAEMLRQAHGYSFPSGHAMESAVAFGALAYLAYRAARSWAWAAAALAFGTTFVLAVALSRVYLGVHWISDVAAGVTAGLVWVITTTVAYETMRRIQRLRSVRRDLSSRA